MSRNVKISKKNCFQKRYHGYWNFKEDSEKVKLFRRTSDIITVLVTRHCHIHHIAEIFDEPVGFGIKIFLRSTFFILSSE